MTIMRLSDSLFALHFIKNEDVKSNDIVIDISSCDHVLPTVYGLPCAHELVLYHRANRPIPLDVVDKYW